MLKLKTLALALASLALLFGVTAPTVEAKDPPKKEPEVKGKKVKADLAAKKIFLAPPHEGHKEYHVKGIIKNLGPVKYNKKQGRTYTLQQLKGKAWKTLKSGKVKSLNKGKTMEVTAHIKVKPKKGTKFRLVISKGDNNPKNDKL